MTVLLLMKGPSRHCRKGKTVSPPNGYIYFRALDYAASEFGIAEHAFGTNFGLANILFSNAVRSFPLPNRNVMTSIDPILNSLSRDSDAEISGCRWTQVHGRF